MGREEISELERLGNSQRVDHLVRGLWDQALTQGQDFGDPGDPAAADAFVGWLRGPAEHGAGAGINRYLYAAYLTRPDLRSALPDLDASDGDGLVRWALGPGRRDLLAELLPTVAPLGVNVIGFLGETLGLGEAGRLYVAGLQAANVSVSTTAVAPDAPGTAKQPRIRRDGSRDRDDVVATTPPTFNLACVNADFLVGMVAARGPDFLGGLPTIGQWGWETDVLPAGWANAAELVDEVWVYSSFVAQNLGRLLSVPVVVVPPPVIAPVPAGPAPIIDDDRFTFLCMLDLFSTPTRKNPAGVIDAFKRAFTPDEGPRLVVKTLNGTHRPGAAETLLARAEGRPDIAFFDGYLSPEQKGALLARADCLVSLHRSEGFGLVLAEAMTLGTPVVATAYSGNLDFTSELNSWLVDWQLTRVGPDSEVYPARGHWAEPDLAHAAEQLRRVVAEPERAAAKAARAREDIAARYAPKAVGEIARARFELLSDRAREPAPAVTGGALTRLSVTGRRTARRMMQLRD